MIVVPDPTGDRMVGRGALLDFGGALGTDGELLDGFAIGPAEPAATIAAQGDSAVVGTGDFLLVRTGRLARAKLDSWGFEVRPNEFRDAFQPLHQVAIPNPGLCLGEMGDLDELAAACAEQGRWDFLLAAAPIPFTGAVGASVNPVAVL